MNDGHDAVIERWLISAQKLRRSPSVMISRSPNRTIVDFDTRSFSFSSIYPHAIIERNKAHISQSGRGMSSHVERALTTPQADPDPVASPDPDDRRNEGGKGEAQALARAKKEEAGGGARQAHDPGCQRARQAILCSRSSPSGACAS